MPACIFLPILGHVICCMHRLSLSKQGILGCRCVLIFNCIRLSLPIGYPQPPDPVLPLAEWYKVTYLV